MSKRLLSLLAIVLLAAACGNDDSGDSPATGSSAAPTTQAPAEEPAAPGTVVEVAVESGAFPTLVAAVQAAGLVETLNGTGPFTVFAPTEDAFADALAALDMTAEDLLGNVDLLTAVLTYHVLPIAAPAETVLTLDGQSVTTVNGADVTITIDGAAVMVNDANVVTTDVEASNGVIHVIDKVLLPPEPVEEPAPEPAAPGTVVDVAVASGQFPTLVAAVQAAGLDETLSGDGPFTVFAPTEDAFADLFARLGLEPEVMLGNVGMLTSVLTYHVLPQAVPASTVVTLDGQSVPTVQGADITITVDGETVMVNDATVVTADVEASNGVIHVIDQVLFPPSDAAPEPAAPGTVVDVAVASGQFPTLVAAVQAAGLDETLSGDGPFTVFAPTEQAFADLLASLGLTAEQVLGNVELLTSVLTYHVLPLAAPAETVLTLDGQSVTTVNGADVTITIDGAAVMVNDANVVTTDVEASNGVIHVIDKVLFPPPPA